MVRQSGQRGFALIMVIAVVSILAVLATTLVAVTVNAMHGTARNREQTQAFNLAEAALNKAMNVLATQWPSTLGSNPQVDPTTFWTQFASSSAISGQFAAPAAGGARVSVQFYDNIDTTATWDTTGDKRMWIEAQGNVGQRSARVRAMVFLPPATLGLVAGQAIWTPGTADIGGSSGVSASVLAPGTTQATIYCSNPTTAVQNGSSISSQINLASSAGVAGGLSPEVLGYLKDLAQSSGTLYTNTDWIGQDTDLEGVIYIDAPGQTVTMPSQLKTNHTGDGVNTVDPSNPNKIDQPGLLIVNAAQLTWESNATFYGLVYCSGTMNFQGTPQINGMLISDSTTTGTNNNTAVSISGDYAMTYNDTVRQNLNTAFPLNIKIVGNSWQEIQPRSN
jgi:Tfp pilus assembly protein PilX